MDCWSCLVGSSGYQAAMECNRLQLPFPICPLDGGHGASSVMLLLALAALLFEFAFASALLLLLLLLTLSMAAFILEAADADMIFNLETISSHAGRSQSLLLFGIPMAAAAPGMALFNVDDDDDDADSPLLLLSSLLLFTAMLTMICLLLFCLIGLWCCVLLFLYVVLRVAKYVKGVRASSKLCASRCRILVVDVLITATQSINRSINITVLHLESII